MKALTLLLTLTLAAAAGQPATPRSGVQPAGSLPTVHAPLDGHRRNVSSGGSAGLLSGAPRAWVAQLAERHLDPDRAVEVTGSNPVLGGQRASGAPHPLAAVTWTGQLGYANASYGPRYLAIPAGPGVLVEVCGPAACLTRTSTDAGPDLAMQRAGRIADVSAADFPVLCGVPISRGLCPGTILVLKRPALRLPETDMEER